MVLHHSQTKGTAKLLLLGIANHQGDSGAWPSVATLAKYTATSPRRVQQILHELRDTGELDIDAQGGPSGTNRYWVTVSCPESCDRSSAHRGGEAHFRGGMKPTSPGGVKPTSPEPSLEPLVNQRKRATRLSEDWKPSERLIEWCQNAFPHLDSKSETECFIDYWVAKPSNATKLDWERTWMSWMRRASRRGTPRGKTRRSAAEDNWAVVQKFERVALDG